MENAVYTPARRSASLSVTDVAIYDFNVRPHRSQVIDAPGTEIIEHADLPRILNEPAYHVTANKAGTTGN
jgi:hypothetical protein